MIKIMLNFTEQLSHGHFDTEIEYDYNFTVCYRLITSKTGFEEKLLRKKTNQIDQDRTYY